MGSIVAAVAAVLVAAAPPSIVSRDGSTRYVAVPAGSHTLVAAVSTRGGRLLRTATVRGTFRLPVVARDGTVDGLSFDGRTLVLTGSALGARSRFAVIDTRRLARRTLSVSGSFTFDALSPDGRTLYLIEYVSPRDLRRYRVRAYDLTRGRLQAGAVADKRTGQTAMEGVAVSRATSRDARWAYTLYAGGPHPFVHALDTVRREAVCLDVHGVGAAALWSARLAVAEGGSRLLVRVRGRTLATVPLP